jgi:hypothetical protein
VELAERKDMGEFTQQFDNLVQLVYVGVTGEQRISTHHLGKQTAHRPDVHLPTTWRHTTLTEMWNKYSKILIEGLFWINCI